MSRLLILDAMGLAYRAYYAFIRRPLVNSRGENTSAIFGLANTVLKLRRDERPDYWVLAWDGPGPTHRHERYPDYKATRKPMPEDLLTQIPALAELAAALGLPVLEAPGVEADDVMATLAQRGEQAGHDVALVTSDKDMLQLVGERVRLLSPVARGEEYEWVDREAVIRKWGVEPGQIRDVLALMGDTSDNIPGVRGVGQKTATELIARFGSIESLYQRLGEVERAPLREKLAEHHDAALLSKELVTVRTDCDLPDGWEHLRCAPMRRDALLALARRWELQRLEQVARSLGVPGEPAEMPVPVPAPKRRGTPAETAAPGEGLADPLPMTPPPAPQDPPAAPIQEAATVASQGSLDLWGRSAAGLDPEAGLEGWTEALHEVRARAVHGLAVLPVIEGAEPRRVRLVGLALAARDGASCYVPLAHASGPNLSPDQARRWLELALADPTVPKVGEDLKRDAHALATIGLAIEGFAFDVHVGSFLCDPERDHSLGALARDVLGVVLEGCDALAAGASLRVPEGVATRGGRGRVPLSTLPPETVGGWAEPAVRSLFPLADALQAQLAARQQLALYERVEHPLLPVLLDMERAGVHVDVRVLAEMSKRAVVEMTRLEEELYSLAGERFNLNSGPQLARVLFEKLGLKSGRRTKTGFSTDQAVLEELASAHPFPVRLIEYRALAKLHSTYLATLPQMVDPRDGRVHTTFHPTGAATGRLSSSNPNLQNIPMRMPQGRAIRRAFVAGPGRVLVGADYSQIELRVMAHLSGDPRLIEAFQRGEDVHASTARTIFGIAHGELDPVLRARAKVVNFGVMYGMGARRLSRQMGIGLSEAQEFIAGYFRVFARVREFLDSTVEEARRRGYVETLLGRRRHLPGLEDPGGARRAFAERAAINTSIQGSAADLMKLAMIHVHRVLKRSHASARLLLQVHDELLLECPADEAGIICDRVRQEMEGSFVLRVPLEVTVGCGASWFDVH